MTDKPEPKKRGRPKGSKNSTDKVEKLIKGNSSNESLVDISSLTEDQKMALLGQLNKQLNIKPPKNSRQVQFKGNKFVDDLKLCKEDREFTKKVAFSVSERGTRKIGTEAVCERCKKPFTKYFAEYLCNDCGVKS